MADGTKIEWTDATWNPITGCSVVSTGCKHCYAMKLAGTRLKHVASRKGLTVDTKAGPVWTGEVRFNESELLRPLSWRRPRMIFVCAHGDLFHEAVPDEWIDRVFAVMALAPQHTFQVLTKRPARMREYLGAPNAHERMLDAARLLTQGMDERLRDRPLFWPLRHAWLGVSVEDQAAANERIPILLDTPAALRWISAEPLLGPVDLQRSGGGTLWLGGQRGCGGTHQHGGPIPHDHGPGTTAYRGDPRRPHHHHDDRCKLGLDWVVAGGESGPGARPMHPDWARSLRDQCAAAGVPFLFKQWGEWGAPTDDLNRLDWPYHPHYDRTHWFDARTCARPAAAGWSDKYHGGGGALPPPPFDLFKTPEYLDQVGRCHQAACRAAGRCQGNEARAAVTWVGKKAAGRLLDGVLHDAFPEVRNG